MGEEYENLRIELAEKSAIEDLFELLKESGATVTFDPYRDVTKGCSQACFGMNKEADQFCANHLDAIKRGDFFVKGGNVSTWFSDLQSQLAQVKEENKTIGTRLAHLKLFGNCDHCEPIYGCCQSYDTGCGCYGYPTSFKATDKCLKFCSTRLYQELSAAREVIKDWIEFEEEQIAKEGPYAGERINSLIIKGQDFMKQFGGKGE